MQKMVAGNGLLFPIFGFASCVAFIYMSFGDFILTNHREQRELSFVERNGTQFMVDGRAFYINGWNSYWLMDHSVDEDRKPRVNAVLEAGAKMGLTVCRTWAFNDGGYNALQVSPGRFDERVFRVWQLLIPFNCSLFFPDDLRYNFRQFCLVVILIFYASLYCLKV